MKHIQSLFLFFFIVTASCSIGHTMNIKKDSLNIKITNISTERKEKFSVVNLELESTLLKPRKYYSNKELFIRLYNKKNEPLTLDTSFYIGRLYLEKSSEWNISKVRGKKIAAKNSSLSLYLTNEAVFMKNDGDSVVFKLYEKQDNALIYIDEWTAPLDLGTRSSIYETTCSLYSDVLSPNVWNIYSPAREYGLFGKFILQADTKGLRAQKDGTDPACMEMHYSLEKDGEVIALGMQSFIAGQKGSSFFIQYPESLLEDSSHCALSVNVIPEGGTEPIASHTHTFTIIPEHKNDLKSFTEQVYYIGLDKITEDTLIGSDKSICITFNAKALFTIDQILETHFDSEYRTVWLKPYIITNKQDTISFPDDFYFNLGRLRDEREQQSIKTSYIDLFLAAKFKAGKQTFTLSWKAIDNLGNSYLIDKKNQEIAFTMPLVYSSVITVSKLNVEEKAYDVTSQIGRMFSKDKGYGKPELFWKVNVNSVVKGIAERQKNTYSYYGSVSKAFYFLDGDDICLSVMDFDHTSLSDHIGSYCFKDPAKNVSINLNSLKFGDVTECNVTLYTKPAN